jgi:hypothetical protein
MTAPKLKTALYVAAGVRLCSVHGVTATVARHGDDEGGAVLLKLNRLGAGVTVLAQTRTAEGELVWTRGTGPAPVSEAEADAYIARQVKYDPDLWVVEIEDREGRHFFQGRLA